MPNRGLPGLMVDRTHPLARGLVGWWPLNEGAGIRANDISGMGNHGTLTNGPAWLGSPGGRAVYFDGSDDYITCPHSVSLNQSGDFTLCAWFFVYATGGVKSLIAKRTGSGNATYEWFINGTTLQWFDGSVRTSVYTVATQVPFFVVGSKKGTTLTIYINGRYDSAPTVTDPAPTHTDALLFGKDSSGQNTNCLIWNVRLYSRALSASEALELYADPYAGARKPRVKGRVLRAWGRRWRRRSAQ